MMKLDTAFRNGNASEESLDEFQLNLGCFIVCILDKADLMENNDILLDILIETADRNDFHVDDATKQRLNECFELDKICEISLRLERDTIIKFEINLKTETGKSVILGCLESSIVMDTFCIVIKMKQRTENGDIVKC
ncbi:hypothetical protein K0M31_007454 [Melipona bicolor]|uniref:Uncharacterized protein n=1 Tax=Melipona bicolor TaxID=60889 RepID=A0AA40GBI8_9HYME|nr:hypothetical protein K0M31_007454 [Melipona bicolor]